MVFLSAIVVVSQRFWLLCSKLTCSYYLALRFLDVGMLIARSKPWESNDCSQLAAGLRKCCHIHGRFELKILLLESGRRAKLLGQLPGHYHLRAFPGGWFTWQASLIRQSARTLPGDWLVIARLWNVRIVSWKGWEPEEIRHSWRSQIIFEKASTLIVAAVDQHERVRSLCGSSIALDAPLWSFPV